MFSWLCKVGYLRYNPWQALPRLKGRKTKGVVRFVTETDWQLVENHLAALPPSAANIRLRFILMAYYLTRGRLSELSIATMADVLEIRRPTKTQWWLRLLGKGGLEREVPIPGLLPFLYEYRKSRGLPEAPMGEDLPLISHLGSQHGLGVNRIHKLVKTFFDTIPLPDPSTAARLRRVTAHWLRHSSATHAVDRGESLHSVQSSLGHASLDTTSIYVHADRDKQYAAFEEAEREYN